MRLFELIDFKPRNSKNTADSYKSSVKNTGAKTLGNGAFGTAYQTDSGKRLNQITKVARTGNVGAKKSTATKVEEDAFLAYLKSIQGIDNPYYPELHDLKIFRDANGTLSFRANMHQYYDFTSPKILGNIDLMTSLYDDMFYRDYGYFYPDYPGEAIQSSLVKAETMPEIIKDPDLAAAMKNILRLCSGTGFDTDLHSGNIMWKITGNRPQLKLIDPIA